MVGQAVILDLPRIREHEVAGYLLAVHGNVIGSADDDVMAFVIVFADDLLGAFMMHHGHHGSGLAHVLLYIFGD